MKSSIVRHVALGLVGTTVSAFASLYTTTCLAATGDPIGPEFLVSNSGTLFGPPATARDGVGDTIITWARGGANPGVFGRLYDAAGTPKGSEFAVPLANELPATAPGVAMDRVGEFVIVSTSADASSLYFRIQAQRYAADGTALGPVINVASVLKLAGLGFASAPSVAIDANGDFVIVWSQGTHATGGIPDSASIAAGSRSIYARLYAKDGTPKGAAFCVQADLTDLLITGGGPQAVAMDDNGNFVVAWNNQNLYDNVVAYKRFDAGGHALSTKAKVLPLNTNFPYGVDVAADSLGNFLIAWSEGMSGGLYQLVAQRFSANGEPLAGPQVLSSLVGPIGMQPDGEFVVAGPAANGIRAQRFAADGTPLGGPIQVTDAGEVPGVAVDGYGDFVVTWARGGGGVGQYGSIYARLFNGH